MSSDWNHLLPRLMHDARALLRKPAFKAQMLGRELAECGPDKLAVAEEIIAGHKMLDQFLSRVAMLDQALHQKSDATLPLKTVILSARLSTQDKLKAIGGFCPLPPSIDDCEVPVGLQTVLAELIENAIRFHSDDRALHVTIDCKLSSDELLLEISDTGSGWDSQFTDKMFLPFERLDAARGGFGLGLAIAEGILKNSGGAIRAATTSEGSKFTVQMPLQ